MHRSSLVMAVAVWLAAPAAYAIDMPDLPDALAIPGGKVVVSMIGSGGSRPSRSRPTQ